VELIFVTRTATLCIAEGIIKVLNNIDFKDPSLPQQSHQIHKAITGNQSGLVKKGLGTSSKRSKHSISIGLQMMHSHTQHLARYCMLSHSKPHVTNVKIYPKVVTDSIMKVYAFISDIITNSIEGKSMHPFASEDIDISSGPFSHRKSFRKELLESLLDNINFDMDPSIMFKSCFVHIAPPIYVPCKIIRDYPKIII
jgi:hypothetical protein